MLFPRIRADFRGKCRRWRPIAARDANGFTQFLPSRFTPRFASRYVDITPANEQRIYDRDSPSVYSNTSYSWFSCVRRVRNLLLLLCTSSSFSCWLVNQPTECCKKIRCVWKSICLFHWKPILFIWGLLYSYMYCGKRKKKKLFSYGHASKSFSNHFAPVTMKKHERIQVGEKVCRAMYICVRLEIIFRRIAR